MRILYDLAGANEKLRFSPYCFRVKLAMQLKRLEYQTEVVRMTEKDKIEFSGQGLLPVLRDGELVIADSWKILQHLDTHYPQYFDLQITTQPLQQFIRHWCDKSLHPALFKITAPFVHANLAVKDQGYFRETREKRINKSLEALASEREIHLLNLNLVVEPLRQTLSTQKYLAGDHTPGLADLLVLSAFLWPEALLPFALFEDIDAIQIWRQRVKQEWGITTPLQN